MTFAATDKSFLPIVAGVVTAHLLLIASMIFFIPSPGLLPLKPKEKLLVRTLKLASKTAPTVPKTITKTNEAKPAPAPPLPSSTLAQAKAPSVSKPEAEKITVPIPVSPAAQKPKENPKPVKKIEAIKPSSKTTPKTTPKESSKPAPKPTPQKTSPKPISKPTTQTPLLKSTPKADSKLEIERQKKQAMIASAQKSLSKMDQKETRSEASFKGSLDQIKLPQALGALAVDTLHFEEPSSKLSFPERGYREELASRLKLLLKLPELGIVKLKLTLSRSGKVSHVAILSSESSANRAHIQKVLPTLSFPSFGDNFGTEASHSFQITLSSD